MKPRLFWTMLVAFALAIGLSVCGMLVFIGLAVSGLWQPATVRETFDETQRSYAASLGDFYAAHGNSWSGVDQRLSGPPFAGPNGGFVYYTLADTSGRIIASSDERQVGQQADPGLEKRGVAVEVDGQRVGTFFVRSGPMGMPGSSTPARRPPDFFWPIVRSFLIAGLALASGLLLLAIFFAQRLSHPLRDITRAAQRLAAGQLDVQVRRARIRELDQLTQAFNAMARSLEQADKQRRQMTADIAHELRTPLTIIKGRLEGLQDGIYSPTPEEVERLLGETALLERLVEDLRLLALAEAGQLPLYREPLAPIDLLESARAAFARQAAEQGVVLQVEAPCELPQIEADPQRMAQVLANLVTNALRYTPAGGSIALSATQATNDKRQTTNDDNNATRPLVLEPSSFVTLRVRDSGKGIAPEDLPYVFDRFYRADRSRARGSGGAGLGLAITRQIVVAHGGAIWAESEPGQGTTISIALPVAEQEPSLEHPVSSRR
ncbi:MAG TPA: ATP-binding protein [Roseiflexaceae bacterium]|nr:ATP-binding protein [Roseiflexaceae bacterium]